jgi:hypothetical protein
LASEIWVPSRIYGRYSCDDSGACLITVFYKGFQLTGQRLDMVVDDVLIVEIKAAQELHKAAHRQLYNYLRATGLPTGLLLHFGPKPQIFRRDNPHARREGRAP